MIALSPIYQCTDKNETYFPIGRRRSEKTLQSLEFTRLWPVGTIRSGWSQRNQWGLLIYSSVADAMQPPSRRASPK